MGKLRVSIGNQEQETESNVVLSCCLPVNQLLQEFSGANIAVVVLQFLTVFDDICNSHLFPENPTIYPGFILLCIVG